MSHQTLRPSRRAVVRSGPMLGGAALAAPGYIRRALASSGELNWFTWEDQAPEALVERFEADTGIRPNVTTFSSNEDCLNKLRAAGGVGWDIVQPSITWLPTHVAAGTVGVLDLARIPNLGAIVPSFVASANGLGAKIDGRTHALPYRWGTEAVALDANVVRTEYGRLSFGDLWNPEYRGRMLCRQRSIMLGTGLWMERTGALAPGTMRAALDSTEAFDLGYRKAAEFVIADKAQIANWWQGTADTQSGFLEDGAVIGMNWDGPIKQMRNQRIKHMVYMAPIEGALLWMDSPAMASGAENIEQSHASIDWCLAPGIVLGISSFILWSQRLGLRAGWWTAALAQSSFIAAYCMLIFLARLQRFDPALEEAALDLGATPRQVFLRITVPYMRPALLSAAALAFLQSFGNFTTTQLAIGAESTFTIFIANSVRQGVTPAGNAVAVVRVLITVLAVAGYELARRRAERQSASARRAAMRAAIEDEPAALWPAAREPGPRAQLQASGRRG